MDDSSVDENLFPAIGQVFVIVVLGYVCGRLKILRPEDGKSLSWFAGTIALPALLFQSMANIDFMAINWAFMGGIVLSKCLVFVLVATVTFLVKRPWHPGYAGLYAIFSEDANDLALGLPIMTALYSRNVDGHIERILGPGGFDYISYMYLVAPIALLLLNPIGFVLIEIGNQLEEYRVNKSEEKKIIIFIRILLKTVKGIVKSPVVFMTVLGVIVNFIIVYGVNKGVKNPDGNLPSWLSTFLSLLGGGFAPLALFHLGNSLVGKLKLLSGSVFIVDMFLIIAKSLLLPFLILLFLSLFGLPQELTSFGFLYGTFPTTPSVFVYSTTYEIGVDVISTSMVLGTFISAPLMYATARVTLIEAVNETQYHEVVYLTEVDVSAISLVGAVLVFVIFMVAKRYKSRVYVIILHLIVAQILTNVGAIGTFAITNSEGWKLFFFTIYEGAYLAMKMWSVSLAVMYFIKMRWGEHKAEWFWIPLLAASWMLPFIGTITLVIICALSGGVVHENVNDTQLLGTPQLILDSIFVLPCLLISVVCMFLSILYSAKQKGVRQQSEEPEELDSPTLSERLLVNSDDMFESSNGVSLTDSGNSYGSVDDVPLLNLENDDISVRETRSVNRDSPEVPNVSRKKDLSSSDKQEARAHLRITILLVTLVAALLWSTVWLIWTFAVYGAITGTYMLVTILTIVIVHGQGFIFIAIFGLEKHWFWTALIKKLRRVMYAIEVVELPAPDELEPDVLRICVTFKKKYKEQCIHDIVSTRKYHMRKYENVFVGKEFVKWLLREKIVSDREEGLRYGQALLYGRVIAHVHREHYFHYSTFFYEFCESL